MTVNKLLHVISFVASVSVHFLKGTKSILTMNEVSKYIICTGVAHTKPAKKHDYLQPSSQVSRFLAGIVKATVLAKFSTITYLLLQGYPEYCITSNRHHSVR